jgi:hypothetical protein
MPGLNMTFSSAVDGVAALTVSRICVEQFLYNSQFPLPASFLPRLPIILIWRIRDVLETPAPVVPYPIHFWMNFESTHGERKIFGKYTMDGVWGTSAIKRTRRGQIETNLVGKKPRTHILRL